MDRKCPITSCAWLALCLLGCINMLQAKPLDIWGEYTIGLIGSASTDPTFNAIRAGAQRAISEAEMAYKLDITLLDETPRHPSASKQIKAVRTVYVKKAAGLLISPTDPNALVSGIDFLVDKGLPVMTVGSDSPNSKRSGTWLMDETKSAELATESCIQLLGKRGGNIAILSGDPQTPSQAARLEAARKVIDKSPNVKLHQVYHCDEDLSSAFSTIQSALEADRDNEIDAWIFLGDWPLSGAIPLPWDTAEIPSTAIGALPPNLPYLKRKEVKMLVAQDYFNWGYHSMKSLIEQIHNGTPPANTLNFGVPEPVTLRNLETFWNDWTTWNK